VRSRDRNLAAAFRGSFRLETYCDAWYNGEPTYERLPITGGTIEYDLDSNVQGTLTLTISDEDGGLVPLKATDVLAPYGQEVHVTMAIAASDHPLLDPLSIGWFRIQDVPTARKWWYPMPSGRLRCGGSLVELTAQDRMSAIAEAKLLQTYQPIANATVMDEITRLAGDLVPMGSLDPLLTDDVVSASLTYDEDRVAAITGLAASIDGAPRMDSMGFLQVVKPTEYGTLPVWTFDVGDRGFVTSYTTSMTRDGVVNAVIASGEAASDHAPVVGYAFDLDPGSPSRWAGPFGEVPAFYTSPLLTTAAKAAQAARTRLNTLQRGREREFTITCPINFLLELDDPVVISLPDITIPGRIVKMSLPLTPADMTVTVRALDTSVTTEVAE
jgi:hypothetical protein